MVTLTTGAAERIEKNLDQRKAGVGIRIGVKTTGCSGFGYVLEYVDQPTTEDMSFVSQGVHVFVDPKSLVYIDGLTVDYVRKGLNEGFEFINPNEKDRCGCGESFRV
jgi:iron-sulfur cluster assembly protein